MREIKNIFNDADGADKTPGASSIGALLLDAGKITPSDAERIIRLHKERGLRFGDAAKELGLITEDDIQKVLSRQFDFHYIAATEEVFHRDLIAAYQPFNMQVEMLRAVRSQLMLRWFSDSRKALAIVSPDRYEGRSFVAANLAIVFSQLGERTLLIDADLRQPKQNQLFKLQQKHGLSDFLAGRVDHSAVIRIPAFRDLSIVPAGTIPPNPVELISRGIKKCIQHFAEDFDVILIDTPAFTQGIEAQLLSVNCAGALFTSRLHETRLLQLEKMKAVLTDSGVHCVGSVINDVQ